MYCIWAECRDRRRKIVFQGIGKRRNVSKGKRVCLNIKACTVDLQSHLCLDDIVVE